MNFVRYEPWSLINRLRQEIDSTFDGAQAVSWAPSVDVLEDDRQFTVHADLPGVEAGNIHVTAENGILTICGERRFERKEGKQGFERLERLEGNFLRRFTLPENANSDDIKARHNNGVLEVTIPKQAAPEPRRVNVEVN